MSRALAPLLKSAAAGAGTLLVAAMVLTNAGSARVRPEEALAAPTAEAPMLVVVDVASQRLVAYRGGAPIAESSVSTGKPGYSTPLGVFTILQKDVFHRSNQYSNAPMPFMQRLTWQGVALHAGVLPGYPASHGCIRLPAGFAKQLFGETRLGMTVMVVNQNARRGPGARKRAPVPAFWRPGLSTRGPVSIVVSGADRRMIVLRGSVAIGSAPVAFDGVIDRPQAYVLDADGGWRRVALPGESTASASAPAAAAPGAGDIESDDPFHRALGTVIGPGTTMLVVPDSLAQGIGAIPVPAELEDDAVMSDWHADAEVTGGR